MTYEPAENISNSFMWLTRSHFQCLSTLKRRQKQEYIGQQHAPTIYTPEMTALRLGKLHILNQTAKTTMVLSKALGVEPSLFWKWKKEKMNIVDAPQIKLKNKY